MQGNVQLVLYEPRLEDSTAFTLGFAERHKKLPFKIGYWCSCDPAVIHPAINRANAQDKIAQHRKHCLNKTECLAYSAIEVTANDSPLEAV